MKQALVYSLKVWLTAATVTPILAYLIWYAFNTVINHSQDISLTPSSGSFEELSRNTPAFKIDNISLDIFQSTLYSIPYWLILFVTTFSLNKQAKSTAYKKGVLVLISILLTIAPFTVLNVVDEDAFHKLQSGILAFECLILTGIWFYDLSPAPAKMMPAVS